MSIHKPIRTCIGCGEKRLKHELLRIVRTPEKRVEIDANARMPGRGAYVCYKRICFELAVKRKSLERSLKISVPAEFKDQLLKFLDGKNRTAS